MSTFVITYDLRKPGRNYNALYEALKAYPNWAHLLESVWIIQSNHTASSIRDALQAHADPGDAIAVLEVNVRGWATASVSKEINDWLKTNV